MPVNRVPDMRKTVKLLNQQPLNNKKQSITFDRKEMVWTYERPNVLS